MEKFETVWRFNSIISSESLLFRLGYINLLKLSELIELVYTGIGYIFWPDLVFQLYIYSYRERIVKNHSTIVISIKLRYQLKRRNPCRAIRQTQKRSGKTAASKFRSSIKHWSSQTRDISSGTHQSSNKRNFHRVSCLSLSLSLCRSDTFDNYEVESEYEVGPTSRRFLKRKNKIKKKKKKEWNKIFFSFEA